MSGSLPRYFVARGGAQAPESAEVAPILQIIDSFIVGGRHISEMDCVVGVDAGGDLQICGPADVRGMDEVLQGQLAFNELSATAGRRLLSVSKFHLFACQLVEQPGDSPGINDPVYLYGKLFGPFPESGFNGIEGQLTVTRADILSGMIEGSKYGFTYAVGTNHAVLPTKCHHFMVPCDNDADLARGAGVVIVYPLPTAELAANDPSNEMTTKQILFDILQSLQKDLLKNNIHSRFSDVQLPVPSMSALRYNLEQRGYAIKGNTAVKKLPVKGVGDPIVDGVLDHLYGKITKDKLDLPREGSVNDFMDVAKFAMQSISGWPPQRCKLVAGLSRVASPEEIARASQSFYHDAARCEKTPQRPFQVANSAAKVDFAQNVSMEKKPISNPGPPTWTKDFTKNHSSVNPPILTPSVFPGEQKFESKNVTTPAKSNSPQGGSSENRKGAAQKPGWMDDFSGGKPEIKDNKTKQDENESKPDWMADFQ